MIANAPDRRGLGNWASQWPELFWIAATWLAIFPLGWLRYRIDGKPYSLGTAMFYLGSLACIIVSARLLGKPKAFLTKQDYANSNRPENSRFQFLISFLALIGVIYVYFQTRSDFAGIDVSSMRTERTNVNETRTQYFANLILAPIALASVVYWLKQGFWIRVGATAGFLVLFWKAALISGARFELMPIPLLGAIGLWYGYTGQFFRKPLKTVFLAIFGIGIVISANSFYNIYSTKGGGESDVAAYIRSSGASVFELVGLRGVPIVFEELVGSLAEYVFSPLFYLDFYVKENPFAPTMGTHQFSSVFLRLGIPEAYSTKQAVDELYSALGIHHNVWATGLREMMIDFGLEGAVLQCVVMGGLLGLSKRFLSASVAANHLYLVLAAYHMATPLVNLFKSRLFEFGFYGALAWFVVDAMFYRNRRAKSAVRIDGQTQMKNF